jgi:hypothetical protein
VSSSDTSWRQFYAIKYGIDWLRSGASAD